MNKLIRITPGGTIQMLYDDRFAALYQQGQANIRRVSNVEPGDPILGQNSSKWYATMTSGTRPVLGPYDLRQQALDAEVEWLNEHVLTSTQQTQGAVQ